MTDTVLVRHNSTLFDAFALVTEMLRIDGSQKSGSGTILRHAISLATLLGEDLHIWNIRARREKPGLRAQHLQVVSACQEVCGGTVEGAKVGSTDIIYRPGRSIHGGEYRWAIGTAGSTTMLAMSLLPLGCFADCTLSFTISGGLFQDFAPSPYHTRYVLLPLLKRMGIDAHLEVKQPGYVPRGGGLIEVRVEPLIDRIKALALIERGKVQRIKGVALSSHLETQKVAERMAAECEQRLAGAGYQADIERRNDTTALQKGAALVVWAETDSGCLIGFDRAGRPGRTSEVIGKYVATNLIRTLETEATVDRFLADQLVLYAALAEGTSQYNIPEMTDHVEANLWLVEQLLGARASVKGNVVSVEGVGLHK